MLGCPSDENNNPPPITPPNPVVDMDPKKDMDDMKDMPDMDMGGDMDKKDMDMSTRPLNLCTNVTKLNTIEIKAGVQTFSGDTLPLGPTPEERLKSGVGTSCGFQNAAERVFEFQVDKPARITATLKPKSQLNWVMELRKGDCEQNEQLYCSAQVANYIFVVQPGETYYLVAEPRSGDDTGAFDVDFDITPLVCLPVGGLSCMGNDVALCEQGGEKQTTYECASACTANENRCGGDVCANMINVTGSGKYTAKAKAYRNTFNFKDSTKCVNPDTAIQPEMGEPIPNPGDPGNIDTPGQDIAFNLTGLKKGQKVTIDATTAAGDQADSAIFVLNSCDPTDCRIGLDIGDKLTQWEVPEDGDYVIVVDRVRASELDIAVDITIE